MLDFVKELTRRKVWLFGGIYLALGWVAFQVAIAIESTMKLPDWVDQSVLVLLALGFPFALLLAWAQESQKKHDSPESEDVQKSDTNARDEESRPPMSLAILSFNNLSDERELNWISEGIAEDVTTRLSMIDIMKVTARNSAFTFKGTSPNIREVGKTLKVRFVVEGSVRKFGDKIRITAQLIDTLKDEHIWADSWDHSIADMSEVHDAIVNLIAGETYGFVLKLESDRVKRSPEGKMSAEEIWLLGFIQAFGPISPEGMGRSHLLMQRALLRFPNNAEIHGELAYYAAFSNILSPSDDDPKLLSEAEEHINKALSLSVSNPRIYSRASFIMQILGRHEEGLSFALKALETGPMSSLYLVAFIFSLHGRYAQALDLFHQWLTIAGSRNPERDAQLATMARCLMGLGRFAEAENILRDLSIDGGANVQKALVIALAHQGKQDEAQTELNKLLSRFGGQYLERDSVTLRRWCSDKVYIALDTEGLELAGYKPKTKVEDTSN